MIKWENERERQREMETSGAWRRRCKMRRETKKRNIEIDNIEIDNKYRPSGNEGTSINLIDTKMEITFGFAGFRTQDLSRVRRT